VQRFFPSVSSERSISDIDGHTPLKKEATMSMKNPRIPRVVHRIADADEVLTGGSAEGIPLGLPTAEAKHILRLLEDDLLEWEAHPENRARATLHLEEARDLAKNLRRDLIATLRACVEEAQKPRRTPDHGG
jgi:hypothetical protein